MANFNKSSTSGELNDFTEWTLHQPIVETFRSNATEVTNDEQGRFKHPSVEAFCNSTTPSQILFEEDILTELTNKGESTVSTIHFHKNEFWAIGREDSVHQVQFGNLEVEAGLNTATIPVAVKPFYGMRRLLVNELGAMLKAPELTAVESFKPVGVVRTAGGFALLTHFEGEVVSFDNFSWNRDMAAPLVEEIDTLSLLQKAALSLARLHSNGIIHNDSQVKNIAVATENALDTRHATRTLRLIDLEEARLFNLADPLEILQFLDGVRRDTAKFIGSVLEKGLWRNAGYDDRAEALSVLFAEPYMSYMRHPGTFSSEQAREHIIDIEDRVRDALADV